MPPPHPFKKRKKEIAMTSIKKTHVFLVLFSVSVAFLPAPASAQGLNNNAWSPAPSNRAAVAALIRQVENDDRTAATAVIGSGGGNVTQLICGSSSGEGPTSATAQANSSCIILNNSTGTLGIDQDSEGSQDASADSAIDLIAAEPDETAGGVEEVLATLEGE